MKARQRTHTDIDYHSASFNFNFGIGLLHNYTVCGVDAASVLLRSAQVSVIVQSKT